MKNDARNCHRIRMHGEAVILFSHREGFGVSYERFQGETHNNTKCFHINFGAMIDDFSQILKKGAILLERVTLINPVNLNLLPSLNIVQCRCILYAEQNNISSFNILESLVRPGSP